MSQSRIVFWNWIFSHLDLVMLRKVCVGGWWWHSRIELLQVLLTFDLDLDLDCDKSPINFPKEKFIKSYQKKFSIRLSLIPSLIKIIYFQTPVLIPSLCHPCPPLHHMLQFAKVFRVHHSVSWGSDWSRKQYIDLLRQQHHHLQRLFPEKLFLPRETTCCQGAEVN